MIEGVSPMRNMRVNFRLLLVFGAVLVGSSYVCQGSRIVAVPLPGAPSHIFAMYKICEELLNRGHKITMVLVETDVKSLERWDTQKRINLEVHKAAFSEAEWRHQSRLARFKNPVSGGIIGIKMWAQTCDLLLQDKVLLDRIEAYKGEIILGDWAYFCQLALGEKLQLPRVTFSNVPVVDPVHTTWDRSTGRRMNIPNILAYVPQIGTGLTSPMDIWGRVVNMVSYAVIQCVDYFIFHQTVYKPLGAKHGIQMGSREALKRGVLNLYNVDFAIEYPRPLPPSVKFIGPVMPHPPQRLPQDLLDFYATNGMNGVVYASFGTVCSLEAEEFREIGRALSGLPVAVIWKMDPSDLPAGITVEDLGLGDNVKVVRWAPQNDILGHNSTVAFLTHGGINGLYEAAYHSVPIIGLPMIADQIDNVMKAVHHGFGLAISPKGGIKAQIVEGALRRVMAESSFKEAAARVSKRLRSRVRTPAQEGADWVEHVLSTGGEPYLQTPEDELSVFALYGLDVAGILSIGPLLLLVGVTLWWRRRKHGRRQMLAMGKTFAQQPLAAPGHVSGVTATFTIAQKHTKSQ